MHVLTIGRDDEPWYRTSGTMDLILSGTGDAERISEHKPGRKRCPKCKSTRVSQVLGTFYAKTSKKS